MDVSNKYLFFGGIMALMASLMHVLIIIGGEKWYLFFGAGRGFAQLAKEGSMFPIIITFVIAIVLGVWSLYAFSGTKLIGPLPFLKPILLLITAIFLLRGLLGIPMVYLIDNPYLNELKEKGVFMIISSLISTAIGIFYLLGTIHLEVK